MDEVEVRMKEKERGEGEEEEQSMKKNESDGDCSAEVVRWETILPRMVLRVLLVEPDHATRQIIAALLRKCSYQVTAVPDGLKAWETLKRKAPELDLILTEVQLPAISGFALLTLIMEHNFCKNIPVIMMSSSHDSVSMVLKCMLKGAADFLIKPVRRNELNNLWQHVWRRHDQNTALPQKVLKTTSEDNSASNQSTDSLAPSQKNNECSEKLSEAQDASQLKNSSKLSNFDAVNHEESTKFGRESAKHDDETGEKSITFVLEAARCSKSFISTDLRLEQDHGCTETENEDEVLRTKISRANPNINTEIHGSSDQLLEPSEGAINLIASFGNLSKHTNENCSLSGGNTTKFDFDTQLELSLRRDSPEQASEASEERQILNHSNTSAFSWYGGGKSLQPFFPTPPITSTKLNKQYGDTNQNQEKMTTLVTGQFGQAGPKLSNSQFGLFPGNGVTSDLQSEGHSGGVFISVFCAQSDVHPIWNPKPVRQKERSPFPTHSASLSNPDATDTSLNQNVHDKSTLDHAKVDSPASGQTAGKSLCHDNANRVNSACGSIDNGSDGTATSTVVDKNPESFSDDSACHNYNSFRGTNSHLSSQREAVLEKFRLKRKERCYDKKVRYQSRKRLAEQRPRVKGQFVRQVNNDHHPVTDGSVYS